jgi:hypothetical protein
MDEDLANRAFRQNLVSDQATSNIQEHHSHLLKSLMRHSRFQVRNECAVTGVFRFSRNGISCHPSNSELSQLQSSGACYPHFSHSDQLGDIGTQYVTERAEPPDQRGCASFRVPRGNSRGQDQFQDLNIRQQTVELTNDGTTQFFVACLRGQSAPNAPVQAGFFVRRDATQQREVGWVRRLGGACAPAVRFFYPIV